ncbi:MAG: NUDIX hydrolase [Mizugakiibacter sp.]|uniref:NUDIX hydrolase n=1 Tax=Mizugakiibacter sp. TaxID=1972610 RepID=UPI0031C76309|nr:NUDIX hydrolase [Xanthomonadaceae bacterium]
MTTAPERETEIWRPHVTVAAVVADGDRFLMVEEAVRGELCYNQPAGHLEPGESLADAARRETLEETGWDVELEHFVGVQQWYSPVHGDHIVRFTFAARPRHHHAARPLDHGIVCPHWLTRAEIAALDATRRLRSPLVLLSIDAWLAGQRLPLDTVRAFPLTAGS